MAATKAAMNKKIRQDALREQLQAGGHIQYVVDIAKKFREQGNEGVAPMEQLEMTANKNAADIHLKLINKYLPDLKAVEVEGNLAITPHESWLDIMNAQ